MLQEKKDAVSKTDPEPEPEPDEIDALWEKVSAEMPKWKQRYKETGYKESELVSSASQSLLIQTLRAHRKSAESGEATVDELKDLLALMKDNSFPFIYKLRQSLRGSEPSEPETPEAEAVDSSDKTPVETAESCPDDESDSETSTEDTSLADLNLPSLKGILDTLLDTVGQVEHQADRDNLSVAIYEAFWQFESVTEREQLSILIDCAITLVTESESYP